MEKKPYRSAKALRHPKADFSPSLLEHLQLYDG